MEELMVVAAGGLAREVVEASRAARHHRILGIVDDDPTLAGTELHGLPVFGPLEHIHDHPEAQLVVCTGRGAARRAIVTRLAAQGVRPDRYASVIHPSVCVPRSCSVAAGTILLAQVAITADVRIGSHVVVMPNVTLTHDTVVADFVTLCAGVSLAGAVDIGVGAYIGANASVRENVRVGADATLGMGAALLLDLPAGETWAGVPARRLDAAPGRLNAAPGLVESR